MEEFAEEGTYFDFSQLYTFMVLGGFDVLNKSLLQFILNVTLIFCVALLYLYLTVMAIITIIFAENKVTQIQCIQLLTLIFVGFSLPCINYVMKNNVDNANKMLKNGIYMYKESYVEKTHKEIRKNRVNTIKELVGILKKVMFGNCWANMFLLPAFQYLTSDGSSGSMLVNPYTPLPIYAGFDTRTSYIGYGVCFLSDGLFLYFFTNSVVCYLVLFLSHEHQLIGELEVLNGSLRDIRDRARHLMAGDGDQGEYDRCLYICLKESLKHHQAILRFKNEMRHFIGAINAWCIVAFTVVMSSSVIVFIENPGINIAVLLTALADIFGYFQQCWLGQTITNKSSETGDLLYSTPWYLTDKRFSSLLKVMISNTQKPIVLGSVVINTEANFEMFGNLMSAGYKLINLYRTM